MSQADLARLLDALRGALHGGPGVDLGYALTLIGFTLLLVFAAAATAIVVVRMARAVWNMSPRSFLTLLFVGAWVLLIAGLVLP